MSEYAERLLCCPVDVMRRNPRTGQLEIHPCDSVATVYRGDRRLGVCETHAAVIFGPDWHAQATYQGGIWILPTKG